jgi:phasin family protein
MTTKSTKQTGTAGNGKTTNPMEDIVAASQEAVQAFVKASTEGYEKAFAGYRLPGEFARNYDELAVNGKANLEAFVAAGTAYTKGIEALGAEWAAFTKQVVEDNISTAKACMGAKTLQELIELQSQFARSSLDGFMTRSTKVGELATKVAQETAEPLNARFTAVVEKFSKAAA